MKEAVLHKKIAKYHKNNKRIIHSEIPFMSRVIDMIHMENDVITSYELKINDWQKAIEQMKEHQIAVDYCYLCVPQNSFSIDFFSKIKEELKIYGFGLVIWDDNNEILVEILKAKKTFYGSQFAKNKLKNNIEALLTCER